MSTDPRIPNQWQDPEQQADASKSYALSGRIMLASIIILFIVVVFLVLLHLYARWYLLRLRNRSSSRRRRNRRSRSSSRIVFYVDNNTVTAASTGGLDADVLKSLPVFVYSSDKSHKTDGSNTAECAVCLSEFEDGETGRVLPKCKHSFHTECIDMWFCSHSSCPLCRSPVEAVETEMCETTVTVEPEGEVTESSAETNLVQTTSLSNNKTTSFVERTKRMDVRIEVPNRNELTAESEFRMTSPSQGFRSPGSRLMSLSFKRIMNMGRRSPAVSPSSGVGPSCAPVDDESDLESAHESSR